MWPLQLFIGICWGTRRPIAMHSIKREMSCKDGRRSRFLSCRTILLVIGLLVTMITGTVSEQQETMVEITAVELEASMQSSVLFELQAAASSVGEGPPTTIPDSSTKNGGVHTGIPDSSAIVGQVFQLKVPSGPANASCNIHVSVIFSFLYRISHHMLYSQGIACKLFNLMRSEQFIFFNIFSSLNTEDMQSRHNRMQ